MRIADFGLRNAEWTDGATFKVQGARFHSNADCGMRNGPTVQGSRCKAPSIADCGFRIAEWTDCTRFKVRGSIQIRIADCRLRNGRTVQCARFKVQTLKTRRFYEGTSWMRISDCGIHAECGVRNHSHCRLQIVDCRLRNAKPISMQIAEFGMPPRAESREPSRFGLAGTESRSPGPP